MGPYLGAGEGGGSVALSHVHVCATKEWEKVNERIEGDGRRMGMAGYQQNERRKRKQRKNTKKKEKK